jgi:UDP-glucose 4-epimerase
MQKAILITGVAGLLGSRFSEWIIENQKEYKIIGIDDLSGGYAENVPKEVNFYQIDCCDKKMNDIFEEHKPTYVYHFAAYAAEGLSPFIRMYNYTNNLLSTANIINNCINHDVKRLVFTSTMAVYGHGDGGVFHEDMMRNPIDPYGVAKAACERDIEIASEQQGLDYCIIRPHNVYGKNQNIWDKYRNVLGIWMYYHLNEQPLSIFGDGSQVRAFSYIDDSLEPLWSAAVSPLASKEIINLGGIKEYTIKDAAEILIEVMGGGKIEYHEKRHEVHIAIPTYEKSIDLLGFEHQMDLKEGLTKMWNWAKNVPMKERFIWENYEVEKGLYTFWKSKLSK